jgi:hypothetical protein
MLRWLRSHLNWISGLQFLTTAFIEDAGAVRMQPVQEGA